MQALAPILALVVRREVAFVFEELVKIRRRCFRQTMPLRPSPAVFVLNLEQSHGRRQSRAFEGAGGLACLLR